MLLGLLHAHPIIGLGLLASAGTTVTACAWYVHASLSIVQTCSDHLPVLLDRLLGGRLLPGCVHIVVVWLLQMIGARAHDL